jgi:hypothetical protein
MKYEIDGERAFPQYRVSVGFTRIIDGERKKDASHRASPLAYPEPVPIEVVQADAQKFWDEIKHEYDSSEDVEIKIGDEFVETWIEGWFSHWTYRLGRTDKELLQSFSDYVMRAECHNERVRNTGEGRERCLMGAEDRYRWKGDGRKGTPAPCNCEHCIEHGITRIDH